MNKKFWLSVLICVALPVILVELLLRLVPFINNFYLSKTDVVYSIPSGSHYRHYYFIGSSHVAAAIDEKILNKELNPDGIIVHNVGRGSSTGTVFYMALQRLAKEGLLDSAKVFMEAPRRLAYYSESKYGGEWINSQNVHLIIPYLNTRSFIEFWKYSGNTFAIKMEASLNYLFYSMRISSLVREIMQRNTLRELVSKVIRKKGNGNMEEHEMQNGNDLTDKGGIKVDSLSVLDARKLACAYFGEMARNQKLLDISTWQHSRLNDIIALLDKYNCKLILYDMPISSVEAQTFETDIAKQNRLSCQKYTDNCGIPYITFDFSDYTDADFPDLWHVSQEKAIEYSTQFAKKLQP
jgi:hypothetical protein